MTLLQLRAVQRRSTGMSLVGDDAQRSNPNGLGLRGAAEQLGVASAEMTTPRASGPDAVERAAADLRTRWSNVAVISPADTWSHKGVEYDAVVVDADVMAPPELYLAASRAAHELVVLR